MDRLSSPFCAGDIVVDIYAKYCDVRATDETKKCKEDLVLLSKWIESKGLTSQMIFDGLNKLMKSLHLVDSREFITFYEFVFFICRERGQKNISVKSAVAGWGLSLRGRFRLLNQWCCFVENHGQHNISEDTWRQVFEFAGCVNEDLDGYDPEGAWPVLVDDFVEHMHKIARSDGCSPSNLGCDCDFMQKEYGFSKPLLGLNNYTGFKRKYSTIVENGVMDTHSSQNSYYGNDLLSKKIRNLSSDGVLDHGDASLDSDNQNMLVGLGRSACSVECFLSKGFSGQLSIGYSV